MATWNQAPSKRRTQTTQAGMPQIAGRKPYAPPAPTGESNSLVQRGLRPSSGMGWMGTDKSAAKSKGWQPQPITGSETWRARVKGVNPYFEQTGPRDVLGKRIVGAAAHSMALEDMLKMRQKGEFDELRNRYAQNIGQDVGRMAEGQVEAMQQSLRRAGSEQAGYGAAAEQAIRAAGMGRAAETLGDFESQLLAVQQQELASARKGFTDFLWMAQGMFREAETQKDMAKFQQGLQGNSGWQDLMGVVGTIAGTALGGPIGGAIGGAIGGMFGGAQSSQLDPNATWWKL